MTRFLARRATGSLRLCNGAGCARIVVALSLALAAPARAETVVAVPAECLQFWSSPGGELVWSGVLSFAACIQDASVHRVDRGAQLPALVERMQLALGPAFVFYEAAIQQAPKPIQLRAAYQVGLAHVALITRARMSLARPELGARLEPLLVPHAKLAYAIFVTIDRAAAIDPELTPDAVTRRMVRSARQLATSLRTNWESPIDVETPLLALP